MNDELDMIEEFQSDSINDLIVERKKNGAAQLESDGPGAGLLLIR